MTRGSKDESKYSEAAVSDQFVLVLPSFWKLFRCWISGMRKEQANHTLEYVTPADGT